MRLAPVDVANRTFAKRAMGYSASEVEDYLREVSTDYGDVIAELAAARDEIAGLRKSLETYQSVESAMNGALLLAQQAAEQARAAAQREADLVVSEARRRAEEDARSSRQSLDDLRIRRMRMIAELRGLLEAHLAALNLEARINPEE